MSRFALTIFCDDVRREVGNKASFMGIYERQLFLEAFPAILSKLCFVVIAQTPETQPFQKLVFEVFKDDVVLAHSELPREQLGGLESAVDDEGTPDQRIIKAVAVFEASPFPVENSCVLAVRVTTESEVIKAGKLRIERRATI